MAAAADGLGTVSLDTSQLNMAVTDPAAWATAMNNLGLVPVGLAGQQLVTDSICVRGFDPNLSMMSGITPLNPMLSGMGLVPQPPATEVPVIKEIIHCKSCTLFPPNPNLPPPSTRERPPGCKTVFVGGLPENATEEIIQEVFEQCGDITAIRKSKKNFCHIRFAEEFMVDKAIYLSGYRMRLGSSTDKKDSGRLHVDFAQARDDFYEWECKQRMLAREERHRRKMEEDRMRPPSPPAIMHYSEHEATLLAEKLKDDSKFSEATTVLLTWIERGEVNRRTANQFYSMVQLANSHVRRLMNEKAAHEQEMEEAKENFKTALMGILTQCFFAGHLRRTNGDRDGQPRLRCWWGGNLTTKYRKSWTLRSLAIACFILLNGLTLGRSRGSGCGRNMFCPPGLSGRFTSYTPISQRGRVIFEGAACQVALP